MKSAKNYFSLFGLPVSFEIDAGELSRRYRELQKAVHPDKFANKAEQEKNYSVQQAALINDAYNLLKNPLTRAKYLLDLNDVAIDDDKNVVMEPEFLMQQMELREALDAARSDMDSLEKLIDQFQTEYDACVKEIKSLFASTSPQFSSVANNIRKMQFFVRLIEEAESSIGAIENN